MERRDAWEAAREKKANVKAEEAAGNVADNMDVRREIMRRIHAGEITLEQGQAELKRIQSGAKRAGKITRSQAFNRG